MAMELQLLQNYDYEYMTVDLWLWNYGYRTMTTKYIAMDYGNP